jgi:putative transposase
MVGRQPGDEPIEGQIIAAFEVAGEAVRIEQRRGEPLRRQENQRLRRAISDLTLDKLILQEAARGNF